MSSLWITLGLIAVVAFCIWMAISLAKASAHAHSELEKLEDEINATRRFQEKLREPRKRGKDLVDSLRRRSGDRLRDDSGR